MKIYFRYIVLVSGLNLGSAWCDQISVEMLMDYITGQMGAPEVGTLYHLLTCLKYRVSVSVCVLI